MPRPPRRRAPEPGAAAIPALRRALLRWYRRNGRDLPWRFSDDPYAVWVSEVMLQQTQVATVLRYYERFMKRFPSLAALAAADEEDVLGVWSGLGYYRRARMLAEGARAVVERHGGELPADPAALLALPGIGRYTAGAIASIAFDLNEPVLDGNVKRVLSRLFRLAGPDQWGPGNRELWDLARSFADGKSPGDTNQALMELGALVCTPRAPRCDGCPLRSGCGIADPVLAEGYPASRPASPVTSVDVVLAVVRRGERFLVERRHPDTPLRGTWDMPAIELKPKTPAAAAAERVRGDLRRRRGLEIACGRVIGQATHGILNRRLKLTVLACTHRRGRVAGDDSLRWLGRDELGRVAVSGATLKAARLMYHRGSRPSKEPTASGASVRGRPARTGTGTKAKST